MVLKRRTFKTDQALLKFQFNLANRGIFEHLVSRKGKKFQIVYNTAKRQGGKK